jgi:putative methyltransferase (TIGR04325 family)
MDISHENFGIIVVPSKLHGNLLAMTPIVIFTYCRPYHTRRTVESLLQNPLSSESDLIVYSDASRTPKTQIAVDEVRAYLATITGFRSVTIKQRQENYGLAKSIIHGVTEVLEQSDRVIVLEDDMLTSPHFLTYMNEALERYADNDSVVSIHGYVYPVDQSLPEAFFLPGADCWGWATWRRGWECFNPDGQYLLNELHRRKLIRSFDFNGAYPYSEMLKGQINGKNDSWAIRWYASALLAGKLTLYPGRSLIHNIGNDDSGTHCAASPLWDNVLSETPIDLSNVLVKPSQEGRQAFEKFFRHGRESVRERLMRKAVSIRRIKSIKAFARDWLPPAMFRGIRNIIPVGQETIRFEADFDTWEETSAQCTGYDANEILAKVLDATLKVKRGEAAFERDSVLFDHIEYAWPVLAGLMWAAARNGGRLNVLDYGGALGSSYFQNCKFLRALPDVRWNVVEQAHYVETGQANIQSEHLRFYETIEGCLRENQPNVVLLSSVLQYLPDPHKIINELIAVKADAVILDRTIVNLSETHKIYIQHVPASIYSATYPCRSLSESLLIKSMESDYQMIADFTSLQFPALLSIGSEFKGYIFQKVHK